MVELVVLLYQLIAVGGDGGGVVVGSGLVHCCGETVEVLYEADLLGTQFGTGG